MKETDWIHSTVGPKTWSEMQSEVALRGGAKLNDRTIMAGEYKHAFAGVAGEALVKYALRDLTHHEGNRDFDFLAKSGLRYDAKTRSGSAWPRLHYDQRVPADSYDSQKCDIYIFCYARWKKFGTAEKISDVFINGWLTKKEFFKIARLVKKENAVVQPNTFKPEADMLFVEMRELHPIFSLPR